MKIIFFGSDDFAAVNLRHLLDAGHEIVASVTGPDKPQGRGMRMTASPIKEIALRHKIPCLQPPSLKERSIIEALRSYKADIFVVVAYGRLLTQQILEIPKYLCMNVHGSLLPRYRGAAPVNWAILSGDSETGVTLQKMALELDAGDIIAQEKMVIIEGEDAFQLRGRMAIVGAELLVRTLEQYSEGNFPLTPQDASQVTYAPKLTREMGTIDWKKKAQPISDQVRGLKPWPGAYTFYNGKMLKVSQVALSTETVPGATGGQVLAVDKNGILVACADKALLIKEVQPESGKLMPAASFAAGYKLARGSSLGA